MPRDGPVPEPECNLGSRRGRPLHRGVPLGRQKTIRNHIQGITFPNCFSQAWKMEFSGAAATSLAAAASLAAWPGQAWSKESWAGFLIQFTA